MQLQLIEKTANSIKIGLKESDTTLITPLLDRLNADKDVKIVRYIETHPELDMPELYVETVKGKPEDAIKKAAESISEYFATISKL